MKEKFGDYETSEMLKELGFNEKCLAWYNWNKELILFGRDLLLDGYAGEDGRPYAPLWQQVESWLWEKHKIYITAGETFQYSKEWTYNILDDDHLTAFDYTAKDVYDPITAKTEGIKAAVRHKYEQLIK